MRNKCTQIGSEAVAFLGASALHPDENNSTFLTHTHEKACVFYAVLDAKCESHLLQNTKENIWRKVGNPIDLNCIDMVPKISPFVLHRRMSCMQVLINFSNESQ